MSTFDFFILTYGDIVYYQVFSMYDKQLVLKEYYIWRLSGKYSGTFEMFLYHFY